MYSKNSSVARPEHSGHESSGSKVPDLNILFWSHAQQKKKKSDVERLLITSALPQLRGARRVH
ncbi:hypothetical protein BOTNAR_0400g00040 [Botryotinia narcissicola]|uniref:Uncharacterized protein n=1 Tax=Botryotinia narcissicola TaxID=278944 RepID=A0A4Z1HN74_9HELO|nr:hypothetical protein BOTNAR_0400g00040 [Botryotinia narcissicola]